jgi:hypothetical protein
LVIYVGCEGGSLNKEAVLSFETTVSAYETALCHIPEGYNLKNHCSENLKIYVIIIIIILE